MNLTILSIPPEDRVSLTVRDLTVSIPSKKKHKQDLGEKPVTEEARILDGVSFNINESELVAIVGGSGSGKTTLLNTLSSRLNVDNKQMIFSGYINYSTVSEETKIKNSYLLQDDVFLDRLTVFETLQFQADLRLPKSVTQLEKLNLINALLDALELNHLRHTMLTSGSITLSGGEQRRLSLAIQLLNRPSLLFLDEPTTGLDGSSSLKLIQILKQLSSKAIGITIIISIHQPRIEITKLFDKICLLTKGGRLVYFGSLIDSANYLNQVSTLNVETDHNEKENTRESNNFVDFIMDLSVKDSSTKRQEQLTTQRIDKLVQCWKDQSKHIFLPVTPKTDNCFQDLIIMLSPPQNSRISFMTEVSILTKRTFITTYRDSFSLLAMDGGSLVLALITGWLFFKPKPDLAGIRSITSAVYIMIEIVGFCPVFIELERLWDVEGINFFREHKEQYVSITGFIISRRAGKLLLEDLPIAIIFAIITFFMWGLRGGVGHFFIYLVITILTSLVGMASAMVCFAIGRDFAIAIMIFNCFYQLQNSACGYYINAATMPVYVRWLKYTAYFWYAFGALTSNQYSNWHGACPVGPGVDCTEYSGNYQLAVLGFPVNWIGEPIGILVAWWIGFLILTCIGLRFKNYDMAMSKKKKNKIGGEEEEDQLTDDQTSDKHKSDNLQITSPALPTDTTLTTNEGISITIENLQLSVSPKTFIGKKSTKLLLDGVSANFTSSSINVIMGPSGSGKTTLLNYLCSRLSKSSNFNGSGSMFINGWQSLTTEELSQIAGYVSQHDTSLIPNLTVRETLYFQAQLRFPKSENRSEIPALINTLIRKMGLKDCAETLIGSEFVKGISGGERRRVSIATQLLSRPKILFLDEPTSGLDSATALSILTLINDLAKWNKSTIILTIHQPNEDMIKQFDTILLLSKGGKVIYSGESTRVKTYFESMKYPIPHNQNIANHILDLVSRSMEEEEETFQQRILYLIYQWKQHGTEYQPTIPRHEISLEYYKRKRSPFRITLFTIASRQFLNTLRTFDILFARLFQTIFLGIIHALFFSPLKHTTQGIANRLGLVQEVLNLYFVGLINNIALYPTERDIFYHEYKDGIYGVAAFTLSYLFIELPMEIIPSMIFSALVVFVVGLPRTAPMFFSMLLCSFVSINAGESLGIILNSLLHHLGLATNVLSIIIMIAVFMGGTMSLQMPGFFKGINYINPMKYAVDITAQLGFENQTFKCIEGVNCALDSGKAVLEYYKLGGSLGVNIGALVACFVVYRLISILAVYIRVKFYN
ncbi:ABC transporter family protein [Scheffersomyces coipomensis]|uniref:ABC transporter family protein n=1 Tax=Scheffersomyces coipomensis TaxID=1788519 RepID=UPI00315D9DCF